MSLLMSVTMSFVLSLIGNLSSGRFTFPGFIRSFLISLVIGLALGFFVPIRKISASLLKMTGTAPETLKGRCLSSLVSALVYTPLMTFAMVYMAYRQATAHGAALDLGKMLWRSECISILASFVLSFVITPIYSRMIFNESPNRKEH